MPKRHPCTVFTALAVLWAALVVGGCQESTTDEHLQSSPSASPTPAQASSAPLPQEQSDEELTRALHGDTWQDRHNAATVLGQRKSLAAVPALLQALQAETAMTPQQLADRGPFGADALAAPEDTSARLKRDYYIALADIGLQAEPQVQKALEGASPAYADYLSLALCYYGDKSAFERVNRMVSSSSGCERAYAARAIGELGMSEAVPALREALKDSFSVGQGDVSIPLVRECARVSLRKLGVADD